MLSKATNDQETSQPNAGIRYQCETNEKDVDWRTIFLDNSGTGVQSHISIISMTANDKYIILHKEFNTKEPTYQKTNMGEIPIHSIGFPQFTMAEILTSSKTFQINEHGHTIMMSLNPRLTFRCRDSQNEIEYIAPNRFSILVRSAARMISKGKSSREQLVQLVYREKFKKALCAFRKTGGFVYSGNRQI